MAFATFLYTIFNLLALLCNLFGRITLMQIFSSAAVYNFIETLALIVFQKTITKALLLQIQGSRVRKEYTKTLDYVPVVRVISRAGIFCSVIIWLMVFIINLNLFHSLYTKRTGNIHRYYYFRIHCFKSIFLVQRHY